MRGENLGLMGLGLPSISSLLGNPGIPGYYGNHEVLGDCTRVGPRGGTDVGIRVQVLLQPVQVCPGVRSKWIIHIHTYKYTH